MKIVIILSEVKPGTKPRIELPFLVFALFFFFLSHALGAGTELEFTGKSSISTQGKLEANSPPSTTGDRLNDCNWMVNYRGKTYDLSPLTREALSRPIETDIRYALQRIPESAQHLDKMSSKLKEARAHTILASLFVSGFLVGKIIQSRETDEDKKRSFDVLTYGTGLFFLGSTLFSWKATREAKQELVNAVDAFNANSPHKIEPISSSKNDLEFSQDFPEASESESTRSNP